MSVRGFTWVLDKVDDNIILTKYNGIKDCTSPWSEQDKKLINRWEKPEGGGTVIKSESIKNHQQLFATGPNTNSIDAQRNNLSFNYLDMMKDNTGHQGGQSNASICGKLHAFGLAGPLCERMKCNNNASLCSKVDGTSASCDKLKLTVGNATCMSSSSTSYPHETKSLKQIKNATYDKIIARGAKRETWEKIPGVTHNLGYRLKAAGFKFDYFFYETGIHPDKFVVSDTNIRMIGTWMSSIHSATDPAGRGAHEEVWPPKGDVMIFTENLMAYFGHLKGRVSWKNVSAELGPWNTVAQRRGGGKFAGFEMDFKIGYYANNTPHQTYIDELTIESYIEGNFKNSAVFGGTSASTEDKVRRFVMKEWGDKNQVLLFYAYNLLCKSTNTGNKEGCIIAHDCEVIALAMSLNLPFIFTGQGYGKKDNRPIDESTGLMHPPTWKKSYYSVVVWQPSTPWILLIQGMKSTLETIYAQNEKIIERWVRAQGGAMVRRGGYGKSRLEPGFCAAVIADQEKINEDLKSTYSFLTDDKLQDRTFGLPLVPTNPAFPALYVDDWYNNKSLRDDWLKSWRLKFHASSTTILEADEMKFREQAQQISKRFKLNETLREAVGNNIRVTNFKWYIDRDKNYLSHEGEITMINLREYMLIYGNSYSGVGSKTLTKNFLEIIAIASRTPIWQPYVGGGKTKKKRGGAINVLPNEVTFEWQEDPIPLIMDVQWKGNLTIDMQWYKNYYFNKVFEFFWDEVFDSTNTLENEKKMFFKNEIYVEFGNWNCDQGWFKNGSTIKFNNNILIIMIAKILKNTIVIAGTGHAEESQTEVENIIYDKIENIQTQAEKIEEETGGEELTDLFDVDRFFLGTLREVLVKRPLLVGFGASQGETKEEEDDKRMIYEFDSNFFGDRSTGGESDGSGYVESVLGKRERESERERQNKIRKLAVVGTYLALQAQPVRAAGPAMPPRTGGLRKKTKRKIRRKKKTRRKKKRRKRTKRRRKRKNTRRKSEEKEKRKQEEKRKQ